jgi:hypothetical protein
MSLIGRWRAGYTKAEAVGYFRSQLAGHWQADMRLGPFPLIGTGIAEYQVIDELAGVATGGLRHDLLGLDAAYAELVGWLYQDAGDLAQSAYWRDKALETAHRVHNPQLVGYTLRNKAFLRTDLGDGQASST